MGSLLGGSPPSSQLKLDKKSSSTYQKNQNRDPVAEAPGYAFQKNKTLKRALSTAQAHNDNLEPRPLVFYDSVSGLPVFAAPYNRTLEDFIEESQHLGYLSFRDLEVVWENVRVLENGSVVSIKGTFLGVIAPDMLGNRYSINLSAISGLDLVTLYKFGGLHGPGKVPKSEDVMEFFEILKNQSVIDTDRFFGAPGGDFPLE